MKLPTGVLLTVLVAIDDPPVTSPVAVDEVTWPLFCPIKPPVPVYPVVALLPLTTAADLEFCTMLVPSRLPTRPPVAASDAPADWFVTVVLVTVLPLVMLLTTVPLMVVFVACPIKPPR